MTTDTSEKGLEALIVAAMTGGGSPLHDKGSGALPGKKIRWLLDTVFDLTYQTAAP